MIETIAKRNGPQPTPAPKPQDEASGYRAHVEATFGPI